MEDYYGCKVKGGIKGTDHSQGEDEQLLLDSWKHMSWKTMDCWDQGKRRSKTVACEKEKDGVKGQFIMYQGNRGKRVKYDH